MNEPLQFELPKKRSANIKAIGVGGGGGNAIKHMHNLGIIGVDFVVCNTDVQALNDSPIPEKIQLGKSLTEGLGAGANPEQGKLAAEESIDEIETIFDENTKMVFITAGMGGGTGTGAAPVIAEVARKKGILSVGIVTAPFFFEGNKRMEQANEGINELRKYVDSILVINNDKLRELYGNLGYKDAFSKADEVLATAAKGIAEVITERYQVNIDLNDAKRVLKDSGTAIMGSAVGSGDLRAKNAIGSALDSPLLNNNNIAGAKNVLLLIVSGTTDVTMDEIAYINEYIQHKAKVSTNIIMGLGEDTKLGEDISVTVVATGFSNDFTGLLDEKQMKTYHTLEEDQKIIKRMSTKAKTIQPSSPASPIIPKAKLPEAPKAPKKNLENKSVKEEEEEEFHFNEIEVKDIEKQKEILKESTFYYDPPKNNTDAEYYVLDDSKDTYEPLEYTKRKEQHKTSKPIIEEEEIIFKIIDKSLDKEKVSDEVDVDDFELPAYKRNGVNLDEVENPQISRFTLDTDENKNLKLRDNNSFLHDNVD